MFHLGTGSKSIIYSESELSGLVLRGGLVYKKPFMKVTLFSGATEEFPTETFDEAKNKCQCFARQYIDEENYWL